MLTRFSVFLLFHLMVEFVFATFVSVFELYRSNEICADFPHRIKIEMVLKMHINIRMPRNTDQYGRSQTESYSKINE